MTTKNTLKISWEDLLIQEDENYAFINKPAGLSTLDDRSSKMSVLSLAKEQDKSFTPCHRLDKETSGVLSVAKNEEAYKYFAQRLEAREVKKVYHAVVNGIHDFQNVEADEPLYSSSSKSRVDFNGKPSLTLIQTLKIYKKHTLVKCFPFTGRMHQIRVHLAFHQAPIVSDSFYGGAPAYLSELKRNFNQKKYEDENPMIRRLALHAFSLSFLDPKTDKTTTIEAPYPKDFAVLVKQLGKFT